jgi:hypothetical protein
MSGAVEGKAEVTQRLAEVESLALFHYHTELSRLGGAVERVFRVDARPAC